MLGLFSPLPHPAVPQKQSAAAYPFPLISTLMNKTIPLALLAALIALVVFHFTQTRTLRESVQVLEKENVQLQERMKVAERTSKAGPTPQPAPLPTFGAKPTVSPSPQSTRSTASEGILLPGGMRIVHRTIDPTQTMAERNQNALAETYASLFQELGFTEAEKAEFIQLKLAARDSSKKLFAKLVAESPERSAATMQTIAQVSAEQSAKEADAKIRQLYGDATADAIGRYEKARPATVTTDKLRTALANTSTPLTKAQAEQLHATIMSNSNDAAGNYNPSANAKFIAQDAAKFLSREQLEAFMKVQQGGPVPSR